MKASHGAYERMWMKYLFEDFSRESCAVSEKKVEVAREIVYCGNLKENC